ncbi:hypothetical protein CORC01_03595 [Colletotrichum orchidophilum]|uniref:Uncharacterized protein n=1 Tax=Colletotrichum orchidophilum TaxID=1209926 RepID=A0A1G4BIA2_9PEZI|nr:uncharacterized protein CORC01_03595 [Colletotrichum orchidophilum]OHF01028.1 hypothetical protein CORC01_03595 [Colletotrichum orchidophilum]
MSPTEETPTPGPRPTPAPEITQSSVGGALGPAETPRSVPGGATVVYAEQKRTGRPTNAPARRPSHRPKMPPGSRISPSGLKRNRTDARRREGTPFKRSHKVSCSEERSRHLIGRRGQTRARDKIYCWTTL